jgi:hypothetical protein
MNHTKKNYSPAFPEHGIHNRLDEHQGGPELFRQHRRARDCGRGYNLLQVGPIQFLANAARDRISHQSCAIAKSF